MLSRFSFLIAVVLILATSCKTQNLFQASKPITNDPSFFAIDSNYQYRIRKDDKISVSVWENDDLSVGSVYGEYNSNEVYGKWLMVDANGDIMVPKLGNKKVEGLTIIEAEAMLKKDFAKLLVNPIIKLKVLNRQITVMGELKSPGQFLLEKEDNTLLEVLGKAGDFDFYADKKNVRVIRKIGNEMKTISIDLTTYDNLPAKNLQIHPGDIVYVPAKNGKQWDKRSGSTIIPATAIVTTVAVLLNLFK